MSIVRGLGLGQNHLLNFPPSCCPYNVGAMIPYNRRLHGATLEVKSADTSTYREIGRVEWVELRPKRRDPRSGMYEPAEVWVGSWLPLVRDTVAWRITLEDGTCYEWGWLDENKQS